MFRELFFGLIISIYMSPALCLEAKEFGSIDSFVKSFRKAEIGLHAEGDLMGKGRADWAGQITTTDENGYEETQIYILERLESGNYAVIGKTTPRAADGGTGNNFFEGIEIKNRSLFVDFSYHWHECSGHALSQFKLYKNIWQMIGVKSDESNSNDDSGISISSDTNLITGNAIVTRLENGKKRNMHFKISPRIMLFKDYTDAGGLISMHEKHPLC
jgi:hypothetical protein